MSALSDTSTPPIDEASSLLELDRDTLLQMSRRVDWRFLLPRPDLADIAYVGQADRALIESLRHFSTTVTLLTEGPAQADSINRFPLAVVSNPTLEELSRAVQATCTGGFVYVEVSRRQMKQRQLPRQRLQLRSIRGCRSQLRGLQLSDVRVHWHWPTFESCTEMIPLEDRTAVICALRRRGTGLSSRWKARIARVLLECHVLEKFVSCFSILGRKS